MTENKELAILLYMVVFVIIVAVLVSVGISVYRAKKIEQMRKEEKRKQEQKFAPKTTSTSSVGSSAPRPAAPTKTQKSAEREDPFPAYRPDPFGGADEKDGCMTAQEYGEWVRAFRRNETAGVHALHKSERQPVFARYLHTSGFAYRSLRKACGFAPQNRLHSVRVGCKRKPEAWDTAERNEGFTPDPLAQKTPHSAFGETQRITAQALPKKSDARTAWEGFYKDIA